MDLSNEMALFHALRMQLETREASCLDSGSSRKTLRVCYILNLLYYAAEADHIRHGLWSYTDLC